MPVPNHVRLEWTKRCALLVLLLVLLLPGCTASFTYDRLDWLIPWWVNGYVDISREERKLLQAQLEPALAWHRQEELARYDAWLAEMASALDRTVSPVEVLGWMEGAIAAAERIEESMLKVAVEFGATISDRQLAEFIASVQEEQDEFEEEFLSRTDQEYIEENTQNMVEFAEKLLDRLDPAQIRVLEQAGQALKRFDTAWLAERRDWLQTMERLLQREPGWQHAVMAAWDERRTQRTPEYRQLLAHNLALVSAAYADLLNNMNPRQRDHAHQEIRKLRDKLAKLQS